MHKETIPQGKRVTTYIYSRNSLVSLLRHFTKGRDLVRLGITHFATSYLTLGCMHENKETLKDCSNAMMEVQPYCKDKGW